MLLCEVSDIWILDTAAEHGTPQWKQAAPSYRTSFIERSDDNEKSLKEPAVRLSLTSLSKLHFNAQFLALLRIQSLLKLEFSCPDCSVVGFAMSNHCLKAGFISRKRFTSLLITLPANPQSGNKCLGNLPNSPVTRRTRALGKAKSGRQYWPNHSVYLRTAKAVPYHGWLGIK